MDSAGLYDVASPDRYRETPRHRNGSPTPESGTVVTAPVDTGNTSAASSAIVPRRERCALGGVNGQRLNVPGRGVVPARGGAPLQEGENLVREIRKAFDRDGHLSRQIYEFQQIL